MKGFRIVSFMIAVWLAVTFISSGLSGGVQAMEVSPKWGQEMIDDVVSQPLGHVNSGDYSGGAQFGIGGSWRGACLTTSEVLVVLANMAYYNPELKATSGKKVSDRLVEHLTAIALNQDWAPACRGDLGGWIDGPVSQALALAKHTPAVWSQLEHMTKDNETVMVDGKAATIADRWDFIMSVMALTGNYMHNSQNNPTSDLSQKVWCNKDWNPNHINGYISVMVAAYYYFGGAGHVNHILVNFDYDTYTTRMREFGYNIMLGYYQATGKELLEQGGRDTDGTGRYGSMVGVKIPFTFSERLDNNRREELAYDPVLLYGAIVRKMYSHTVESELYEGTGSNQILRGYTVNRATSPYEGMLGMATEFKSSDEYGFRTDATYIDRGLRLMMPVAATIRAFEGRHYVGANDYESRMYVGTEDFRFKIAPENGGYMGWAMGKLKGPDTADDFTYGYRYFMYLWDTVVKKETGYEAVMSRNGALVSGTLKSYNFQVSKPDKFTVVLAEFDAEERLVDVETRQCEVAKMTQSATVANLALTLQNETNRVRLFVWDGLDTMRPLVPVSTK